MSSTPTSARNQVIPAHHAAAYIIGTATIMLPTIFYWMYGPSLFGTSPLLKLFLIAGAGGTLSFALYAGRKLWLAGGACGLFSGLGAAGLHVLYTVLFQKQSMVTGESGVALILGAAPGMTLLAWLLHRGKSGPDSSSDTSGHLSGKSS